MARENYVFENVTTPARPSMLDSDVPANELYGADDPIVAVYADGGVIFDRAAKEAGSMTSTIGGVWAWCHVNAKGIALVEQSGVLEPKGLVGGITNNYAEYVAALRAIEALPDGSHFTLYLDSKITLGRFCFDWAHEGIPNKLRLRKEAAMRRMGSVVPVLLDGHPTRAQLATGIGKRGNPVSLHNVWCDDACDRQKELHLAKGVR